MPAANSGHDDVKRALSNVLWVGGSVCAGKTSAAGVLAARHRLRVYHFDRQEPLHIFRSVPERQPHLIEFMAMTMDQRWVLRSPAEMARQTMAARSEDRFPMVVDDLLGLPGTGAILAEGAGLFPEQVEPLPQRCAGGNLARIQRGVHPPGARRPR